MVQITGNLPIDLLPTGRFLYPLCTDRETWRMMLDALYRAWSVDEISQDVIADFLNAQIYVSDPENSPCSGCDGVESPIRQNGEYIERLEGREWVRVLKIEGFTSDESDCDSECEDDMGCCVTDLKIENGVLKYYMCGKWYSVGTWSTNKNTGIVEQVSESNTLNRTQPDEQGSVNDNPAPVETFPERSNNACAKAASISDSIDQLFTAISDSLANAYIILDWGSYFEDSYPHIMRKLTFWTWQAWKLAHGEYSGDTFTILNFDNLEDGLDYFAANKADVKALIQCAALEKMTDSATLTDAELDWMQNTFSLIGTGNANLDNTLDKILNVFTREYLIANANDYIARSKGDCGDCRQGTVDPAQAEPDGLLDVFTYQNPISLDSYGGNMTQVWGAHSLALASNANNDTQRRLSRTVYVNDYPLSLTNGADVFVNVTASDGSPSTLGDFAIEIAVNYTCNGTQYSTGYLVLHGKRNASDMLYTTGLKHVNISSMLSGQCGASAVTIQSVELSWWSWIQSGDWDCSIDKLYIGASPA